MSILKVILLFYAATQLIVIVLKLTGMLTLGWWPVFIPSYVLIVIGIVGVVLWVKAWNGMH